jgi:hypothetical protein
VSAPGYTSPILDSVAGQVVGVLRARHGKGAMVPEISAEPGASPSTVGNVLRGASADYGAGRFAVLTCRDRRTVRRLLAALGAPVRGLGAWRLPLALTSSASTRRRLEEDTL